jgi:hypothetical protein
MVKPQEQLVTTARHIGMKNGRRVVEVKVEAGPSRTIVLKYAPLSSLTPSPFLIYSPSTHLSIQGYSGSGTNHHSLRLHGTGLCRAAHGHGPLHVLQRREAAVGPRGQAPHREVRVLHPLHRAGQPQGARDPLRRHTGIPLPSPPLPSPPLHLFMVLLAPFLPTFQKKNSFLFVFIRFYSHLCEFIRIYSYLFVFIYSYLFIFIHIYFL